MKKIICKVIERVFPEQVKRIKETNRARRTAIQAMLDANRLVREAGNSVSETNRIMRTALNWYNVHDYDRCLKRTGAVMLSL